MPSKVLIDGKEVFFSGTCVAHAGQVVEVFPFEDDPTYVVRFKITFFEDELEDSPIGLRVRGLEDPEYGSDITWHRLYKGGGLTSSNTKPLGLASDEEYLYHVNLAVNTFGKFERHTLVLTYSFIREERN